MGILSEIHAGHEASRLEKVLLRAIDTRNPEVIDFCKKNVYHLYKYAVEKAGSYISDSFDLTKIDEVYRK
ncbi:MAG: hypothetical protein AABX31_05030 [Nanoarchaeota archaeon]